MADTFLTVLSWRHISERGLVIKPRFISTALQNKVITAESLMNPPFSSVHSWLWMTSSRLNSDDQLKVEKNAVLVRLDCSSLLAFCYLPTCVRCKDQKSRWLRLYWPRSVEWPPRWPLGWRRHRRRSLEAAATSAPPLEGWWHSSAAVCSRCCYVYRVKTPDYTSKLSLYSVVGMLKSVLTYWSGRCEACSRMRETSPAWDREHGQVLLYTEPSPFDGSLINSRTTCRVVLNTG